MVKYPQMKFAASVLVALLVHVSAFAGARVVVPQSKGGKTVPENLQMLCRRDNALKSDR